ncbi:MAG: hypothetical protein LBT89_01785, partial [Planctomycetaceae bacterium]|nr:hypothetical protein [Planctomycetaceae bacterium]
KTRDEMPLNTPEKDVPESIPEHAGMAVKRAEVKIGSIAASQDNSMPCDVTSYGVRTYTAPSRT